jgi:DHA1 family inner membrane transport protein
VNGTPPSTARDLTVALLVLATATTVVVATEFIIVGLLPVLMRDLAISAAEGAYLVAGFALSASLLGPPLTLAASPMSSRRVLIGTLLLFAAADLAAVLWPTFPMLLAVRIVQGAALPVFVGVGAATISRLSPPESRGRSLALANTGFVLGVVFALPAGVALAEGGQWAPSFIALALLALASGGLVATFLPRAGEVRHSGSEGASRLLLEPRFTAHLFLSVAIFAAMFSAYTYLALWLAEIAGLISQQIALALAGFGIAGLIGNTAAAWIADRAPLRATVLAISALALAAVGISLTGQPFVRIALFVVWGMGHTAAVALCQVRVTLAGRSAPAFAMAMNISAANLGIALGALVGGWVVEVWGVNAIGWGAAGLALVAITLAAAMAIRGSNDPGACGRPAKEAD